MADDLVRLPHLETFRDRGGKLRCYVRDRTSKNEDSPRIRTGRPEVHNRLPKCTC
jgi:hypothetical protein